MKKYKVLAAICISLMVLNFTACGSRTQVPDREIEYVIEEYLVAEGLDDCNGYAFTAKHDTDKHTHQDCVEVTLELDYDYATVILQGKMNFQYEQTNDLWKLRNGLAWGEGTTVFKEKKLETNWSGGTDSYIYSLDISDINFDKGTITCSWFVEGVVYDFGELSNVIVNYGENGTYNLSGKDSARLSFEEEKMDVDFIFTENGVVCYIDSVSK